MVKKRVTKRRWNSSTLLVAMPLSMIMFCILGSHATAQDDQPAPRIRGRVLIVRGIFSVFSLGMDTLGHKLKQQGFEVKVVPSAYSYTAAAHWKEEIQNSNQAAPLFIVGHSLGGDLSSSLAEKFGDAEIPVEMLIMLDSTMPSSPPQNVRCCVNLYQSNYSPTWLRVFRGVDVEAKTEHTRVFNIDIRKHEDRQRVAKIHHFNIDSDPWIHDLIMRAIHAGCHQYAQDNQLQARATESRPEQSQHITKQETHREFAVQPTPQTTTQVRPVLRPHRR